MNVDQTPAAPQLTDPTLRASIASIRSAVATLWAPDAPRVIRNYTDHGINHCERVLGYASMLMNAIESRPLSEEESYVLLASIYLHDIGMQCDLFQHPNIYLAAGQRGAILQVLDTSKPAIEYDTLEQATIRANHHILTAAWIDTAYASPVTTFDHAIKTIPSDLVDDIIDVCLHHTSYRITDCPQSFRFKLSGRKQFLAALLRLSDELDIAASRVTLDVIHMFRLEPSNALYWWLHNVTNIEFLSKNAFRIIIRLHEVDAQLVGHLIEEHFITRFNTKNTSVLEILRYNGLPIAIDASSGIQVTNRVDRLPAPIVSMIRSLDPSEHPLRALASDVREWLTAIGYSATESTAVDDRTLEMHVSLESGTITQRVLVRCVEGEATPDDVESLAQRLDRRLPQGWLISDRRISPKVPTGTEHENGVTVFRFSEFLETKIWLSYFDVVRSIVSEGRIDTQYVDLACHRKKVNEQGTETDRDEHDSLDQYIDEWLAERGRTHISMLGDFGSGKTWFCRHYTYRQMIRFLNSPRTERFPLLITLRSFSKSLNAQQMINDALTAQYRLPFVGNAFGIFDTLNRSGRLLLILDGFDEMARKVDYQTVVDNFWELAQLATESSKIILTSRTEYFRWSVESEKIFGGQEHGRETLMLSAPKFEVLYINPFTPSQIADVIRLRLPEQEANLAVTTILQDANLSEMAQKPVLVELLLAALDEVPANGLYNRAVVYLHATNRLLMRNITEQKTFTSTADKVLFLSELAQHMLTTGELRIHYSLMPEQIRTIFGDRIKSSVELDWWDFDLRSQSLLHRDAAGNYEFAHKSIAEFFFAFKIACQLGVGAPSFVETMFSDTASTTRNPYRTNDLLDIYSSLGGVSLQDPDMRVVRQFISDMLSPRARLSLDDWLTPIRSRDSDRYGLVVGNLLNIATQMKKDLSKVDLSGLTIEGFQFGRDLNALMLNNSILRRCDLRYSNFRFANAEGFRIVDCDVRYFGIADSSLMTGYRSKRPPVRDAIDESLPPGIFDFLLDHVQSFRSYNPVSMHARPDVGWFVFDVNVPDQSAIAEMLASFQRMDEITAVGVQEFHIDQIVNRFVDEANRSAFVEMVRRGTSAVE